MVQEPALPASLGRRKSLFGKKDEESVTYTYVPLPSAIPATELLAMAKTGLRCMDWSDMSLGLFQGSPLIAGNEFSLSRPVRDGEQIDFFLSRSQGDGLRRKPGDFSEKCPIVTREKSSE